MNNYPFKFKYLKYIILYFASTFKKMNKYSSRFKLKFIITLLLYLLIDEGEGICNIELIGEVNLK